MDMDYSLYILQSLQKQTFYIGSSDNPKRRVEYHNGESKGYTQKHRPWKLVYTQTFDSKIKALKAERIVKNWKSKKMVMLLVEGKIQINNYL